ncbi:GNAT family N-acetyltransferase [Nocardioides sp. AE5]|uniref:GNAT family N-acetyltransferase n=1 Tax=Nocardioides sp. AE5 TaxID=2962573 RepID=UPI002881EFA4|nr:GNAT family N-acetyltransferase [Nocardioides sp. AE5]MDT0200776.1 GNAT family N-acetyltransferase [Nocardioides sp. AE5]
MPEHTPVDGPARPVIRIERVPYGHPDALRLVAEVQAEYVARYGGPDDTPLTPEMFEKPSGSFFVGYVDGVAAATGAWRRRNDVRALGSTDTAEIKRMYVAAIVRRTGLARRMLAHLEATAYAAGARVAILETGVKQPEAIALYESFGYQRIDGFGHYRDSPLSRCFAKDLAAPGAQDQANLSSRLRSGRAIQ